MLRVRGRRFGLRAEPRPVGGPLFFPAVDGAAGPAEGLS